MATAPVYSSALIQALRSADSDSRGVPSGVVLLPNSQNIGSPINFVRSPRTGLAFNPPMLSLPTVAPPPRTLPPAAPPPQGGPVPPPPAVAKPVVPVPIDDPKIDDPKAEDPEIRVIDPVIIEEVTPAPPPPPLRPPPPPPRPRPPKTPTVTVQEVDVTDTPAPPTDPMDDFEIDRELGIVQQSDVFVGPRPLPLTNTTTSLTPSVTVNEVDVTDTPAAATDPADDFEIDRELGLVQQSDVFMGPTQQPASEPVMDSLFTPTNTISDAQVDTLSLRDPQQEMLLGMMLEPETWTLPEPDLASNLPAAVPAPAASNELTDQDLMELALFDMMAQELLTGRRPVVPRVTPRG